MKHCFVCRRLIKGKRDGTKVGGSLLYGDRFALSNPRRGNNREQVELIPVFADQHGAQKSPVLGGKPSVRGEIFFKVATATRVNLVLESGVGGAGVKQECVKLMKSLFLVAADGLCHGVFDRQVMVEELAVGIRHDA